MSLAPDQKRWALTYAASMLERSAMSAEALAYVRSVLREAAHRTAAPVSFSMRHPGWIEIGRADEVRQWPCSMRGALLALQALHPSNRFGARFDGKPGAVRGALRGDGGFAEFLEGKGLAGLELARAVHCIVVSDSFMRFEPRLGVAPVIVSDPLPGAR